MLPAETGRLWPVESDVAACSAERGSYWFAIPYGANICATLQQAGSRTVSQSMRYGIVDASRMLQGSIDSGSF